MNIRKLIRITSFSEETKKELLEKADSLTPAQEYTLSFHLWEAIENDRQNRLIETTNEALQNFYGSGKPYNPNDFIEAQVKAMFDFKHREDQAESEEKQEEIKKELGGIQPAPAK